jgi:hypothetical protein
MRLWDAEARSAFYSRSQSWIGDSHEAVFAVIITSLVLSGGVALAQTNPGSPTIPPQPSQSSIPTPDDTNHSTSVTRTTNCDF